MSAGRALRAALARGLVVAPGVYDGISARLADRYAFPALYLSGYCVSASRFGLPDAGLVGLAEMVEALRIVRRCVSKPVIVDADAAYGGLLNVQHTVVSHEEAGASALQIEDQDFPKKCGHTKGKRIVPLTEMVAKVEVAAETRSDPDLVIIARTDSLASEGFDGAMERCRAYKRAGADIVFIDAIRDIEQMKAFAAAFPRAAMVNIVPYRHFVTLEVGAAKLEELGFAIAIFPGVMAFPAIGSMERSLEALLDGTPADPVSSAVSPHDLMGFPAVWADEERWAASFTSSSPERIGRSQPSAREVLND